MWTILKVFIEFTDSIRFNITITILLLFIYLFFLPQGMWDLSSLNKGSKPTPLALEGSVLTTG